MALLQMAAGLSSAATPAKTLWDFMNVFTQADEKKFPLTIEQASASGLCRLCNFAGRRRREHKPCDYHRVMNCREVPGGRCALTEDDIARKKRDMGLGI